MRPWILSCVALATLAGHASASPITIDKTSAVAAARTDPGTGSCASTIHFMTQFMPINKVMDVVTLLDLPASDPNILGRVSALAGNLNFRNSDPSASGDFTLPSFPDALLPFSSNGTPAGNDTNIAMRLRGYLNVTSSLSGMPVTFGIHCDDLCSLSIGKQAVIDQANSQISARVTQQVIFADPGLYPIEVVYAQNASQAYLELVRAPSAQPEGNQNTSFDTSKYTLIPSTELYSTIVGSNPACQECGAASQAACATGNYCGDGLCQACNTADHCGATCQACPASAHSCIDGACGGCTTDAMCPTGQVCESGTCSTPMACSTSAMCPSGYFCNATENVCRINQQPTPTGCMLAAGHDGGRGALWLGMLAALALLAIYRARRSRSASR